MKKVLCALSAALIFCGCAEARRPWTEALALVSPDRAADAASAVSEHVPDSADIAPIVSPHLPPVSPDMIQPASPDVSAVPAPVPGRTSADSVPAASADLPAPPAPVSPVVSADAAISDDVIVYETLTGSFFTAEAPEGEWRIDESAPGSAAIIAQDRSVFLAVTLLSAKHATLREAAESLAGQYPQGSATLKRMDDPDGTGEAWEFRCLVGPRRNPKPMYAQVFELDRKHYGSIAIVGDPDADDVIDIFNSIRFK